MLQTNNPEFEKGLRGKKKKKPRKKKDVHSFAFTHVFVLPPTDQKTTRLKLRSSENVNAVCHKYTAQENKGNAKISHPRSE